jgi:hypothetical protein
MTANEKRTRVVRKYEEILGRNKYSQARRDYCYKKYSDGKYYSDCSSSVSYAYREAGYSFGILNTVGMYNSQKLTDVPVKIQSGLILNPEVLRPGDLLLFAGSDSSRAGAGYVGHVEMVGRIEGSKITLYGHGSGTPRAAEMNAYCKSRYAQKTKTKLGHKGLIRVRRFIPDETSGPMVYITGNTVNIRSGPGTEYPSVGIAKKGESYPAADANSWLPVRLDGRTGWVSGKYACREG